MKPFWIQKHDFLCLKIIGMLYENRSKYEIYNEIRALMDFTTLDNIQKSDILESRGWITKNGRHIYIGDDGNGAGGWLGMRVLADSKKCAKREIDAYQIEIDLALSLKRKDMAKRLEVLRDDEIKKYGY